MGNYYCLMAGLPEISFDDGKSASSIISFKDELENELSDSDKKLINIFFLKYDCKNLANILKRGTETDLDKRGLYSAEEYQEIIACARETEFNPYEYPAFMCEFVRSYDQNKDNKDYFPEDEILKEYYRFAGKCRNSFMSEWYKLNFRINYILTAMTARKNGLEIGKYISGDDEFSEILRTNKSRDFELSTDYEYMQMLAAISDCQDPVEKEKKISAMLWEWLDNHTLSDFFSINAVFAYLSKLEILERWSILGVEEGKKIFRKIIEDLRSEVRVPDEFKK